jgi:hypothetical protein
MERDGRFGPINGGRGMRCFLLLCIHLILLHELNLNIASLVLERRQRNEMLSFTLYSFGK